MPITTALNTLSSATTIASLDMEASGEAELPIEDPEFNSYGGGIFAGAHHFTVAGGTFNNITKNYISTAEVPPDFRTIPLGDIDLQRQIRADEIRLDQSSGVISRQERGCVQRVYSAKVEGRMSDTTVAVYEGDTAEEEWRRDIAKYMAVRHPHILQVCVVASSGGIHATLFHGDLIPYNHFLDLYQHSPILTAYIYGYTTTQYLRAVSYINSIQSIDTPYNVWIRRSSGLLCLGISPRYPEHLWFPGEEILGELLPNTSITDQEVMVTHHLSLRQYHDCCRALSLVRHESISTSATVTLAALMQWPMQDRFETSHDLICIQDVEAIDVKWKIFYLPGNIDIMANGSIRFKAAEVSKQRFGLYFPTPEDVRLSISMWLSQANHIFHRLQIFGNYTDYVMLHNVHFEIKISPAAEAPLSGYLFLCPPSAFRVGSSSFRWPEYPAYWSSDPLGVERLTTEEATDLGFPLIQLTTEVRGYSWDAGVYTGLRQFHTAKGFDPDSQDVALHLGYPLYKLPNEMETDVPFAHIVDDNPLTGVSVENVLLSEVILESTDSSNLFEPSMSRGFEVISSIQVVLILFLVLSQVYETVG